MVRNWAASLGCKIGLRKWWRVGWSGTKGGATTLGLEESILPRTQGKGPAFWAGAPGLDKRQTEGGAEVKQSPGWGLRERPTALPEPGSVASGPASSPASLACGAAVRGKIAGGGTGRRQRGTEKRTAGLGWGEREVLAHLFVFFADQLLRVSQRQHGQRDLCGTLAGKLARGGWGKGTGIKGGTRGGVGHDCEAGPGTQLGSREAEPYP